MKLELLIVTIIFCHLFMSTACLDVASIELSVFSLHDQTKKFQDIPNTSKHVLEGYFSPIAPTDDAEGEVRQVRS